MSFILPRNYLNISLINSIEFLKVISILPVYFLFDWRVLRLVMALDFNIFQYRWPERLLVDGTGVATHYLRGPLNRAGIQIYVYLLVLEGRPLDLGSLTGGLLQARLLFDLFERVHADLGILKKLHKKADISIGSAIVLGQLIVTAIEDHKAYLQVTEDG